MNLISRPVRSSLSPVTGFHVIAHNLFMTKQIPLAIAKNVKKYGANSIVSRLYPLLNPAQGLQEMVRVLRPGAPLVLVVTRSGLLGSLIQWHWGNRCFKQEKLSALIREAGLNRVQFLSFPIGLARFTSMACIGFRKS